MTISAIATTMALTYTVLLALWLVTSPFARRAFSRGALALSGGERRRPPRRSPPLTSAGVLLVFVANTVTSAFFVAALAWPELEGLLRRGSAELPAALHYAGVALFVLCGIWGLMVLVFNPSYTPVFLRRSEPVRLATKGPYAIVRHPRYAAEAALNVILFLLTGAWFPLLGIVGWGALRRQAAAEEEQLLGLGPKEYGSYRARTGQSTPRFASRRPLSAGEAPMTERISLRDVSAGDLAIFFVHQRDPEATRMAAFRARDREAFNAHWAKILADDSIVKRTVLVDGRVAGNVVCFENAGRREVGYWIGREFWGRGVATAALAQFLSQLPARPLFAHAAKHNRASIRVLEKCRFTAFGEDTGPLGDAGEAVEELVFILGESEVARGGDLQGARGQEPEPLMGPGCRGEGAKNAS